MYGPVTGCVILAVNRGRISYSDLIRQSVRQELYVQFISVSGHDLNGASSQDVSLSSKHNGPSRIEIHTHAGSDKQYSHATFRPEIGKYIFLFMRSNRLGLIRFDRL